MTRTSTFRVCELPTGSNSPSCSTRSSLTCRSSGSSPISSRKIVPPSAEREAPVALLGRAGERALFMAEELALDQLRRNRRAIDFDERLVAAAAGAWIARATSSLPVPVSPRIRTVASVCATSLTSWSSLSSGSL